MIPTSLSVSAHDLLVAMASTPDGGGAGACAMDRDTARPVGDKVVTSGGIYGSVTRISGDSLQLQIADKVRVEISRNAVVGYQGQAPVVAPEGAAAQ